MFLWRVTVYFRRNPKSFGTSLNLAIIDFLRLPAPLVVRQQALELLIRHVGHLGDSVRVTESAEESCVALEGPPKSDLPASHHFLAKTFGMAVGPARTTVRAAAATPPSVTVPISDATGSAAPGGNASTSNV